MEKISNTVESQPASALDEYVKWKIVWSIGDYYAEHEPEATPEKVQTDAYYPLIVNTAKVIATPGHDEHGTTVEQRRFVNQHFKTSRDLVIQVLQLRAQGMIDEVILQRIKIKDNVARGIAVDR